MSKTLTTFFLLLIISFFSNAQRYVDTNNPKDEEIKSLLGRGNDINGFGGVDLKVSDFKDERGMLVGAYGGLLINRHYLFGVAGYGLVTKIEFEGTVPGDSLSKPLNLYGGYGGLLFGAVIAPRNLFHITIPVVFGAGSFEVVDENFFANNLADSDFTVENSVYFVVEPGIQLEVNISNYFRLGAGATYRYITGTELLNVSDDDVSGISYMLSLRFGRF